jgi:osmotically-inducible protein OsmY
MKLRTVFVTSLLPVCSAALIFTGCDRDRTSMGRPAQETERTVGQKVDDKQLGSRVKDALDDNAAYKFPDVKVNVYGGRVQLSGFVQTREQKTKAEDIAKSMTGSGVTVENKITVKE